jgi:hypothetical protein
LSTAPCVVPGCVNSIAVCAALWSVCSTPFCAVPGHVCISIQHPVLSQEVPDLQQFVLHLDVYDQQEPVQYQEVYGPQQPLLHLGVAVFMRIFAAPGPVYKNQCYTCTVYHRERILKSSTLSCNEEKEEITKPPTR